MKANELRIGNKVNYTVSGYQKHIGEITGINKTEDGLKAVIDYHYPLSFGEPIELSPEILEKCGFKKQNNGWNKNKKSEYDENYFGLFDHNYCSGKLDLKYNVGNGPIPSIKFLHQLQNLYFAISGEELEVKL